MASKKKYIKVPNPIMLHDPITDKPLKDENETTFKDFVLKQMSNPLWMESYPRVRSANAVMEQIKNGNGVMVLDEEDYGALKSAVENPKQVLNGPFGASTQAGYGWIPSVTPQLLPFIEAIMEATDKHPEDKGN